MLIMLRSIRDTYYPVTVRFLLYLFGYEKKGEFMSLVQRVSNKIRVAHPTIELYIIFELFNYHKVTSPRIFVLTFGINKIPLIRDPILQNFKSDLQHILYLLLTILKLILGSTLRIFCKNLHLFIFIPGFILNHSICRKVNKRKIISVKLCVLFRSNMRLGETQQG